jgi:predicted ATPase
MRISITGSSCQGKSTLIKDILKEWPDMKTPDSSYRSLLKKGKHSKKTSENTQWDILNHMVDEQQKYRSGDRVVFDRCPIDNIAYTMWANAKGIIDDKFVEKCIPIVRESMRFVDIVFFIPISKSFPVEVEDDGNREVDKYYIEEIDHIIKTIYAQWREDTDVFFPKEDSPAVIEVFGSPEQRIEMMKLYIDNDGDAVSEQGIINPTEMADLQKMFGLS